MSVLLDGKAISGWPDVSVGDSALRPGFRIGPGEWPVSRRVNRAGEGDDDPTVLERRAAWSQDREGPLESLAKVKCLGGSLSHRWKMNMPVNVSGLRQAISEALYPVSANLLADVCEAFGLKPGTRDEAFSSKRNYVMKRLLPLPAGKVVDIARQVLSEYPNDDLERALQRASLTQPADSAISDSLVSFDAQGVHTTWIRALERRERDPEGAITLARTLLEEVCKHIIDDTGGVYTEVDDLPKLYRKAGKSLNLAPDQHTEDTFKRILGGCQSVVEGLGSMRNKLGDAHGRGRKPVKPAPRHAALAVNLAGAMATFLIETARDRHQGGVDGRSAQD